MHTPLFKKGIGLIGLLFFFQTSFAQLALHNTTGLYVESGALLHVDGDLYNLNTIEGRGDIEVTGNVNNQGRYRAFGQGRFTLNGALGSTLSGNWEGADAFYRLHLSKPAGVPVRLTDNIEVDDSLRMLGGLFQTLSNEVIITSIDTGVLTGYPLPGASVDDRYILGNLRRAIGLTQAQYDFPVGDAPTQDGYQLLRFRGINMGGSSNLAVHYDASTGYTAPMVGECGASFDCMLAGLGEWVMTPDAGIPRFDLTLVPRNFTAGCGGGSYTVLTAGSLLGNACTGYSGSLSGTIGTEITRENIESTGPFTITGSSSSFPVEWLSFEAWPDGNIAQLAWATAMEENSDYFEVERSVDGLNFKGIGKVESQGNSNSPVQYAFTDLRPEIGKNYYRLRQVDLDGQFSFSEIRAVRFEGATVSLWPNPYSDRITIAHNPVRGISANFILYNKLGQPVVSEKLAPLTRQELDLSQLPEGAYTYVLIQGGRRVSTGKLVRIDKY